VLRKRFCQIIIGVTIAGFWSAPALLAQLQCTANVGVPSIARSEGLAEEVADLLVTCTGGTPTTTGAPVPAVNISISLDIGVTSRINGSNATESLLLIDEPAPSSQLVCTPGPCAITGTGTGSGVYDGSTGRPTIFIGTLLNDITIGFSNVPLDPPGSGTRILRISNVRAGVALFQLAPDAPPGVTLDIQVGAVPINNPTQTAAFMQPGLSVGAITAPSLPCGSNNAVVNANTSPDFSLNFSEGFASAFKVQAGATQNQPGGPYNSETGFYNAALTGIPVSSLADSGTRLRATFNNVPAGVSIYVSTTQNNSSSASLQAALTSAETGPFSAVVPTVGNYAQIPITNGSGIAVWEIIMTDPNSIEQANFGVVVSYGTPVGAATATVNSNLAPVSTTPFVLSSGPAPRFVDISVPQTAFAIAGCPTQTIYPQPPLPDAEVGQAYSITFAVVPMSQVQWGVAQGALPPGQTLSPLSGLLSGIPVTSGQYTFTIQAQNSGGGGETQSTYTLNVLQALMITPPPPLPVGIVGQPYTPVTFRPSGGRPPYHFSSNPATVPPGFTLDAFGDLTGVPSQPGNFTFSLTVTDGAGYQLTESYPLTVVNPLTITTASPLTSGTIGVAYSQPVQAAGGAPPYTFAIVGTPPPGLVLSPSGMLSGVPTMLGTFNFEVQVTDSLQLTISQKFQVLIAMVPSVQVSTTSLTFGGDAGGEPPAPQIVTITSASLTPVNFSALVDARQDSTTAPAWIKVSLANGTAPAALTVSVDPGTLAANTYRARIRLTIPNNSTPPVDIGVTFVVAAAGPQLGLTTAFLRFAARSQSPGSIDQFIVVRNVGGSGTVNFSASAPSPISWLDSISPATGSATPGNPVLVRVRINTQGLDVGGYKGSILFTSGTSTATVTLSLFVADTGAAMALSQTGLLFEGNQGQGIATVRTIRVSDVGDPNSTVNFTAKMIAIPGASDAANWLTVTPNSGTATAANPGAIQFSVNAQSQSLAAGVYYALVSIADSQSLNSPEFVTVVLDLGAANNAVQPDPVPQGLAFIAPTSAAQTVTVYASSSIPVPFSTSAVTNDGGTWLTVSPGSGLASTASPGTVTVSANSSGLQAGSYTGFANIAIGAEVRGVIVTLIVPPDASPSAVRAATAAATCPSRVILAPMQLADYFASPVSYPATLSVSMYDDCGKPIANGSVTASFSNGDAEMFLPGDGLGNYSATWVPSFPTAQVTVTYDGMAGTLEPYSVSITGGLTANGGPVLNANGVVHNFYPAAALSPGLIAQVYGSGLASAPASPQTLPLPDMFNGSGIIISGELVPLYFISGTQVNIEIPAELTPLRQYNILAIVNGAATVQQQIDVNPLQAGIAADTHGQTIAQHADYSYATTAAPAKPGEVIIIYLAGMGATNPPVASGHASPSPPAVLPAAPVVTVGGEKADVLFFGLTPGDVGLYQINLRVPSDTPSGSAPLVVSQNGIAGNTTMLIVGTN
jgi:uncharacterized protein (TIGR03437 family)